MDMIEFQNISCYCLSRSRNYVRVEDFHFKTSHVIVYQSCCAEKETAKAISKHLMLLFIKVFTLSFKLLNNFKTSHVIVYRAAGKLH